MHSRASITLAIAITTACSPAFSQTSRGIRNESSPAKGGPGAVIFTDRNAFLAALPSKPEINPFDSVTPSESGWLLFERDGYGYGIYTQFGAHGALYNGAGFVSTERIADRIVVRFTGDRPITAIGGNFWSSDFGLRPVHGSIVLKVADRNPPSKATFRGVSSTA
jgi:hypothetical protein